MDYSKKPGQTLEPKEKLKNANKPVISIITPFYNGGQTLEETFISVQNQTYPYFEWIIINDGSKDEKSLKELDRISKLDSRIKIFHKENGGPSIARDYGVEHSEDTKYIFFLDCDDLIDKTMLEVLYWTLETNLNASFAYTAMTNFGDNEFIWEKYLSVEIEKVENSICIASMVKKSDFLEVGGFGIKEKGVYEDWNLWLKLLVAGKTPIRVSNPLFWYRTSNQGELSRAKKNHKTAMRYVNQTAKKITKDVEIIQYPRNNDNYEIKYEFEKMVLPQYDNEKEGILFIIPWTTIGGADIFNLELIKRINKKKYNIYVITTLPCQNALRQEFQSSVEEYYELSSFIDKINYINFTNYIIKSRNITNVLVSNSTAGYLMIPSLKSNNPDVKIIDYIHSVDLTDINLSFGRLTEIFDQFIDKTLTCNDYTNKQLMKDFNKKDVQTIYIGTDVEKGNINNYDISKFKEKYEIPTNKKVITFIARLSEEKRPMVFIDIAQEILKKQDDVYFLIAGDGPLYKEVAKKIKSLKLKDKIKMLGMIKEKYEIYAISDITINCSSLEGLALTSYESLSMGIPVVSANVGGQAELIDDTVGAIVNCEAIEEYIENTIKILNNINYYKNNARKKILEGYTYDSMAKKFNDIFEEKPKKLTKTISEDFSFNIYRMGLSELNSGFEWMCYSYYMDTFGINLLMDSKKEKLLIKIKAFSIKNNILNEINYFVKLLKSVYNALKHLKHLIINIFKSLLYFIVCLVVGIKVIIKKIIKR